MRRASSGTGRGSPAPVTDKHRLYEAAVQDAPTEVDFLERIVRRAGRRPLRLREDFSGTALLSAEWVRRGRERTAVAVDLDPSVHAWARANRLPALGDAARRLRLVTADVRAPNGRRYDAVAALNFSWCVLKTRAALRDYLRRVRASLAPGGVLVVDLCGGWDAQKPLVERRPIRGTRGVRYVWEQESFDPITHRYVASIHFEGPGRRRLTRAFRYDWRLWTIPELTELFAEAGFEPVEVLWDVAPAGEDVRYQPRRSAANQPGWIAYVVGRRPSRG